MESRPPVHIGCGNACDVPLRKERIVSTFLIDPQKDKLVLGKRFQSAYNSLTRRTMILNEDFNERSLVHGK